MTITFFFTHTHAYCFYNCIIIIVLFTSCVNEPEYIKGFLRCISQAFVLAGGGFNVGSKSAGTSPTGSVHNTPTHQAKPNTLDPFADIGNLGASLGGKVN